MSKRFLSSCRRCVWSLMLLLPVAAFATSSSLPPELVLAGGALHICSSYADSDCRPGSQPAGRRASAYALDRGAISTLPDSLRDIVDSEAAQSLVPLLRRAERHHRNKAMTARQLDDALDDACRRDCTWRRMDDDQRAALRAVLEIPQRDADGNRLREQVALESSRLSAGPDVLRAFVARTALRSDGRRPRIAVVTASAFDPYDAVDFYLAALQQAGAEAFWWPLDAAVAEAVFGPATCDDLPRLHRQRLGLPDRSALFPDRVREQREWCERSDAGELPQDLDGVFFSGGDQWKLRRALVSDDDKPNAWLAALDQRHAAGRVVIAGTSAGSAVQSGAGMLSNGTSLQAIVSGPIAAAPPVPGCARRGSCKDGDEDRFTVWPAGGLGLSAPFLIDTHFSERAREWRLMRALADGPASRAIGIDETSAVHMIHAADGWQLRALGKSGFWLMQTSKRSCGSWRGVVSYVASGQQQVVPEQAINAAGTANQTEASIEAQTPTVDAFSALAQIDDPLGRAAIRDQLHRLTASTPELVAEAAGARLSLRLKTAVGDEGRASSEAGDAVGGPINMTAHLSYPAACESP